MKAVPQEIIAGLDIGTTKVCVVIGKRGKSGIEIIGVGQSPSLGVKQGMVVNMESTAAAIRKAVTEAELMAGCEVRNVVVGIADRFIRSRNSPGVVRVKSGEVCEQDVHRVIESVRTVPLPPNHEILHIIPREFIIGNQHEISQPLGMTCSRLEVEVHIVTAASTSIRNIVKSCTMAGLQTSTIVLKSLAAAEAVLMKEERELGVALIDIGGGTTDIAVMRNGAVWHTAEIPQMPFLKNLLAAVPKDSCVLTWNQAFEKGRLEELARYAPDYRHEVAAVLKNIRDLMTPFRRKDIYHYQFVGSYSIKAVLPALVPELSYKGLEVSNGEMAANTCLRMQQEDDEERIAESRKQLLEYCQLDTLAMVRILEKMRELESCIT